MFALELEFRDGVSPGEVLLVRRPHAILGSSEFAHVVVEGVLAGMTDVRLTRGVGREFRCQPVRKNAEINPRSSYIEGVYVGEAELNLGDVIARVHALDVDLQLGLDESPDLAGVRVLRDSLAKPTPMFPALAVLGAVTVFMSFPEEQTILVGRSRKCGFRLDAADVSSEHARFGFHDGSFWVEDLGSTNGTSVGGKRISGRRVLGEQEAVSLGTEILIMGIQSAEAIGKLNFRAASAADLTPATKPVYPCILGQSPLVRPARYPLTPGARVFVGRDPANDIWVQAGHVSRTHVEISLRQDGAVEVVDQSSNGTFFEGQRLEREEPFVLPPGKGLIDLSAGVFLAVCFDSEDEEALAPVLARGKVESVESPAPRNTPFGEEREKRARKASLLEIRPEFLNDPQTNVARSFPTEPIAQQNDFAQVMRSNSVEHGMMSETNVFRLDPKRGAGFANDEEQNSATDEDFDGLPTAASRGQWVFWSLLAMSVALLVWVVGFASSEDLDRVIRILTPRGSFW